MNKLTVALASLLLATSVNAAPYVGLGGGVVDGTQVATLSAGISTPLDALALEGRYSVGPDTEMSGIYGKLKVPAPVIQPYMVFGYSDTEIDDVTDDGASWGVGAEYVVDKDVTLGVEYMSYTGYMQPDVDGVNVTLKLGF